MRFLNISCVKYFMVFTLLWLLTACQTNIFTFDGATIKEGLSVPLKAGGPHKGTWSYEDVSIDFTYTRGSNTLQISGDVHLAIQGYTESFTVRLHFVDKNNKIIGTKAIIGAGYRQEVETYRFNDTFEVPSGTIAFSYDGEVRGISDDGSWSFWVDPRRANKYGVFY